MESMLFVYFANVLPQFSQMLYAAIVFLIIVLCSFVIGGGVATAEGGFSYVTYKKVIKILACFMVLLAIVKPLIPDRDTMYLMAGAYVGQQVLTSQVAKDAYEIIELEVNRVLQEKKSEVQNKIKINNEGG